MSSPVILVAILLALSASAITAQKTASPPILSPAPAPAPAPDFCNLTDLFTVAGPFHTFLNYLTQTKVIDTFQTLANDTHQGITIFVPKDSAFSSLKKPVLSNLTQDGLKSLLLYHALPKYYSFSDFKNLSHANPVNTLAGGLYTLNVTDAEGLIRVDSGWWNLKISSSVYSTFPCAVYQLDKVLIPASIFGIPPPLPPAPAPAPDHTPPSDLGVPPTSLPSNTLAGSNSNSYRISKNAFGYLILAVSGCAMLLL